MRNLDRAVHCFAMGDGTASQDLGEALPFEEFGDQKRSAVMLADVVEGEDVQMAQSGDGPASCSNRRRRSGSAAKTSGGP